MAPVAVDESFMSLNVNADFVAAAVAGVLGAAKLIFLTDEDGIRGPSGEVVPKVTVIELRSWLANGTVTGGMVPKGQASFGVLEAGLVSKVTVASARTPHALLMGVKPQTVLQFSFLSRP